MQTSSSQGPATRVVLVTGGSAGIGRAVIERVLEDGYEVVNFDLKAPAAPLPGETHVEVDLGNPDATRQAAERLAAERDVLRLVNNAGTVRPALLEDATTDDLAFVMALNIQTPMLLAQALLPGMRRHQFGRIVNISSRAALGKTERTVYAASKAGLLGMTRTWALEMGADGITVNAIGPGPIATELFERVNPPGAPQTEKIRSSIPVRRMGTPADVAHGVVSFLDDRAGFITGQVLYVCGGMTVGLGNAA
ncbi:SDR family NAD(P)-dependent oxidoreductase [Bordetella sp. 02P26C-1]|uniref:SDR family NAD(P)-dependent oxidoreductase n=1 Tax=Bordetella sp. 02P26C-1 TaxID=2683195 RepID=UPI001353B372|nr:SDR family oxidoreductase [Bordetella sp. 02P26C-1]MVW77468.1 SDR family oxidoreductase [Bordetella sp. 02P26C-1]